MFIIRNSKGGNSRSRAARAAIFANPDNFNKFSFYVKAEP
jgi:hypothetical protein